MTVLQGGSEQSKHPSHRPKPASVPHNAHTTCTWHLDAWAGVPASRQARGPAGPATHSFHRQQSTTRSARPGRVSPCPPLFVLRFWWVQGGQLGAFFNRRPGPPAREEGQLGGATGGPGADQPAYGPFCSPLVVLPRPCFLPPLSTPPAARSRGVVMAFGPSDLLPWLSGMVQTLVRLVCLVLGGLRSWWLLRGSGERSSGLVQLVR
jgi:hypothetical protein